MQPHGRHPRQVQRAQAFVERQVHVLDFLRLAYYETFGDIRAAINREKQIKGWLRAKKVAFIVAAIPAWRDLSADWYGKGGLTLPGSRR